MKNTAQEKNCIVVLPYMETSRLFHASSSRAQEAYIGENGVTEYYECYAKKFEAREACNVAVASGNNQAFVRQL